MNPKLEAIYNAIEEENHDLAIKLCLKKSDISNQQITVALLSYCYVQQRRLKEAMETARSVMRYIPTDDHVLSTLSHTYRACKAEDELALCYENAINKDPSKDNLMLDLFFIYNRLCDAKKMQLIAQKLYKMKNKPSFVFWSVCSMLLQKDLPLQMLTVAERMIEKVLNDSYKGIQPGAEELELYIHLICKQQRYSDALTTFDKLRTLSPGLLINDDQEFQMNASKVKMHNLQLMTLRLDLLEKLSLKDEAVIELANIIESYPGIAIIF
jgi:tetratricopeptide (TPR) repeat protein